jgi:hypothetical protein
MHRTQDHRALLLAVLLSLAVPGGAHAQGKAEIPPTIDARVAAVATGGSWQSDVESGRCRVVVIAAGWEHVHNEVWLEWLRYSEALHDLEVVSSVKVGEIGLLGWLVRNPSFTMSGDTTVLHLEVLPTYGPIPDSAGLAQIEFGDPGEYSFEWLAEPAMEWRQDPR